MKGKTYIIPNIKENGAKLRCNILVGSISSTQEAAGVPHDTPHIKKEPIGDGASFD